MPYTQSIENVFQDQIGKFGISRISFEKLTKEIKKKANILKNEDLNLFNFSNIESKTQEILDISETLKTEAETLYVLGTGGSTLCPQTIYGLLEKRNPAKKVVFIDNIDSHSFKSIFEKFDYEKSCVLAISKSGRTLETITQFLLFANNYIKKGYKEYLEKKFLVITSLNAQNNNIKQIADNLGIKSINHDDVGGRFSIFSSVGLLSSAFAGIDIEKILKGANSVLQDLYENPESSKVTEGVAINAATSETNITSTVLMPYVDRLKNFTNWWSQIWAESIGKTDQAITPIRSLGTLDQHSQLQLYLEGKRDKLFNIISIENSHQGQAINDLNNIKIPSEINFLNQKNAGNIISAAVQSTTETLLKNGLPVRSIIIEDLDEFSLGEISMHFILETVLLCKLWYINPFDQPAVEQGKKIAIDILNGK